MFGLSFLASAIIAAVITAIAMGSAYFAVQGFRGWIAAPFVQTQILADQKKLDASERRATDAESAKLIAQGNVGRCESALKTQADAKLDADRRAAANLSAARDAKARADKEAAAAAPRIATLQALAAAKTDEAKTCEQQLAAARPVLQEALRRGRIAPGAK